MQNRSQTPRPRAALVAYALAVLALGTLGPGPARADATTDAIAAQEEKFRAAMVASDVASLQRLWGREYVSTSAVGHASTRAESLAAYTAKLVDVDDARISGLDVRTYGNVAVSLGLLDWRGRAAGQPFEQRARFQHVWALRDGQWQLVASQMTLVSATGRSGAR